MKSDYILDIDGSERRFLATELRAEKGSRKVSGYAAVFNKDSHDLGGFIERMAPSAFEGRLNDNVLALLNHDQNFVLARNNKTLKLSTDDTGLKYEFDAPNTTAGNDLLENIRLGNIDKSSFAFTVDSNGQDWEMRDDGPDIRTITKIKRLYDVSPVASPAYEDSSVGLRSRDEAKKQLIPNQRGYPTNIKRKQLKLRTNNY